jgi:outer membrane immunogenic protein
MKKFALSVAVLALSASGAFAADLPSRKAEPILPPPPPPPMWTGFYAGLNAGYGFGTNSNSASAVIGLPGNARYDYDWETFRTTTLGSGGALSGVGPNTQSGFIGGGQVGYNYQWGSSFVLGIEADIQGTGIRGSSSHAGLGADQANILCRTEGGSVCDGYNNGVERTVSSTASGMTTVHAGVDWMGTVRGRLGYLFTPTMLLYATGGLTYGGVYANVNNTAVATTSKAHWYYSGELDYSGDDPANHTFVGGGNKSQTLVGWNVGGGLEWMFMPNWSLKAEAIYWNMGNMNVPTASYAVAPNVCSAGSDCSSDKYYGSYLYNGFTAVGATRVNYQGVIARAGVNYHFNWFAPAPVVARY